MGFLSKRRDNQSTGQEPTLDGADARLAVDSPNASQAGPGMALADLAAQEAMTPAATDSDSSNVATAQDLLALDDEDEQAATEGQSNEDVGGLMDIFDEGEVEVDQTLSALEKAVEEEDIEELSLDLVELTAQWRDHLE